MTVTIDGAHIKNLKIIPDEWGWLRVCIMLPMKGCARGMNLQLLSLIMRFRVQVESLLQRRIVPRYSVLINTNTSPMWHRRGTLLEYLKHREIGRLIW